MQLEGVVEGEGEEDKDPKEEDEEKEGEQQNQEDEQPSFLSLLFSTFYDFVELDDEENGQGRRRRRRRIYDREGLTHHSSPKVIQHLSMFVGLVAFVLTIWFSMYIVMTFLARFYSIFSFFFLCFSRLIYPQDPFLNGTQ